MERLKNKRIILLVGVFAMLAMFILPTIQAAAQSKYEYTVLAPLPGTTIKKDCVAGDPECKTDLETYLPGLFNLLIGFSAAFAVLMIVIGGFQYMSSDALQKKEDGKNRIWNSVKGLVLVIGAWLILYTINPNLLTLNLNIETVTTVAPAGAHGELSAPGVPMTNEQIIASNAIRTSLETEGVLTYAGPCTSGQTTGCVNLNGLTDATLNGLTLVKNGCGCNVTITGGTESGHSATGGHSTGDSVDLRPDSSLNTKLGFSSPKEGDTITKTLKMSGQPDITAKFTYEEAGGNAAGTSTGNHWHVTFK